MNLERTRWSVVVCVGLVMASTSMAAQLSAGRCAIVAETTTIDSCEHGNRPNCGVCETDKDIPTLNIDKEKIDTTALRVYAAKCGKYVGSCVSLYDGKTNIDDESDGKTRLLATQFSMVEAENEMKFDATEPSRGEFNYYNGDRLVGFAQRHGMRVRGHTLVWHSQVPSWLSCDGKQNDKGFTADELNSIMKNHIDNVLGHYKGKVPEWDVCNEVLDDDQSVVLADSTTYKLRAASVWNFAGDDYVERAFRLAHEADPEAMLILNDYGVEFKGQPKAEAFYNLAKHLKDVGAPIHGVGLQCHLDVGHVDINALKATFDRFKAIGLRCIITELDLGMDDTEANRKQQAIDFYRIAKVAMEADNSHGILVWGLADSMTWRKDKSPLLYNGDLTPKAAYYGLRAGLREAASNIGERP